MEPVPPRIEADRLVLRRWEPADAPLLKDAVDASLEHLRAWMDWAPSEPEPVEEVADRLMDFRDAFDDGENGIMGVFSADESRVLGGTGLHARVGPFGLEIGYWIRADATRRGYATELAAVLTRVGIEVCRADRIEIRIDPANKASLGIPRKLGFREEAMLRRRLPPLRGGEPRDVSDLHALRGRARRLALCERRLPLRLKPLEQGAKLCDVRLDLTEDTHDLGAPLRSLILHCRRPF